MLGENSSSRLHGAAMQPPRRHQTFLYWDYESVGPGSSFTAPAMYRRLMEFVKEKAIALGTIHVKAFLPVGVLHTVVAQLDELQIHTQVAQRLKNQSDMSADLVATGDKHSPTDTLMVLVTREKCFVKDIKRLTENGFDVYLIHDVPRGSPHADILETYTTRSFLLRDVMGPSFGQANASSTSGGLTELGGGGGSSQPQSPSPSSPSHHPMQQLPPPVAGVAATAGAAAPPVPTPPLSQPFTAPPPPFSAYIVVDGRRVSLEDVQRNDAVLAAARQPHMVSLRWCPHAPTTPHNIADCPYAHMSLPPPTIPNASGMLPPPPSYTQAVHLLSKSPGLGPAPPPPAPNALHSTYGFPAAAQAKVPAAAGGGSSTRGTLSPHHTATSPSLTASLVPPFLPSAVSAAPSTTLAFGAPVTHETTTLVTATSVWNDGSVKVVDDMEALFSKLSAPGPKGTGSGEETDFAAKLVVGSGDSPVTNSLALADEGLRETVAFFTSLRVDPAADVVVDATEGASAKGIASYEASPPPGTTVAVQGRVPPASPPGSLPPAPERSAPKRGLAVETTGKTPPPPPTVVTGGSASSVVRLVTTGGSWSRVCDTSAATVAPQATVDVDLLPTLESLSTGGTAARPSSSSSQRPSQAPPAAALPKQSFASIVGSKKGSSTLVATSNSSEPRGAGQQQQLSSAAPAKKLVTRPPKEVNLDGQLVPVEQLVPNRFVTSVLKEGVTTGQFCRELRAHSMMECTFAHRDVYPLLQGGEVEGRSLLPNKALENLRGNTSYKGNFCTSPKPHDPTKCTYLHRRPQ